MRFLGAVLAMAFILGSCGERTIREPADRTAELLIGVWDSMDGTPVTCHERLVLNEDRTFRWYQTGGDFTGTYVISETQITFLFTTTKPEIVQVEVDEKFLNVARAGIQTKYTKVPRDYAM